MASGGSAALPPEASTIIESYTKGIQSPVGFLMIPTIFASTLIPLIIALFYFSTHESRKRPVFVLNVCALSLGIVGGIVNAHVQITTILSPFKGVKVAETIIENVFLLWTPMLSETILIIRLLAVCQPRTQARRVALIAFPITMKLLRSAMYIKYLQDLRELSTQKPYDPTAVAGLVTSWIPKVSYTSELLDNVYMSGMFLFQLYRKGHVFDRAAIGGSVSSSPLSFGRRLQTLFWIAATSFVFPVVLGICDITIMFTSGNIVDTDYIAMVNLYLVLISTVFATIWSESLSYKGTSETVGSSESGFTPRPIQVAVRTHSVVDIRPQHHNDILEKKNYLSDSEFSG